MHRGSVRARALVLCVALAGCSRNSPPAPSPGATSATIRIVFQGSTVRRTDLPPSAQACVNGVGTTHTHPSWRNFVGIPLQVVAPDRYDITFDDVPVDTRVSFRINDQNSCDQNPTGAVTRNVFVNNVAMVQNTTTPGQGDEPGFAFSVTTAGRVSQ
jgi:hypothetical protein